MDVDLLPHGLLREGRCWGYRGCLASVFGAEGDLAERSNAIQPRREVFEPEEEQDGSKIDVVLSRLFEEAGATGEAAGKKPP